jgi:DNA-binding CsgD family transcriptional regulator
VDVVRQLDELAPMFDPAVHDAIAAGDGATAVAFVASLWNWWLLKGRVSEGRQVAETSLGLPGASDDPLSFARATLGAARFASEQGHYDDAFRHGSMALDCFSSAEDYSGVGDACRILAIVTRFRGDLDATESFLERAISTYRSAADVHGVSTALNNLAALAIDGGNLARGRELLTESITLKRALGDRRSLATGLVNLADILVQVGDPSAAIASLSEADEVAAELGDARLGGFVAHNLGDAERARGDIRRAILHYEAALAIFEALDAARDVTLALCSLGRALNASGATARAEILLRRSEAIAVELGDARRLVEVRAALGELGKQPTRVTLPGGLTSRQADVIGLLAGGLTNGEIAERLGISVPTIERHIANLYRKIGVHSRVDATRFALRHGLVSD